MKMLHHSSLPRAVRVPFAQLSGGHSHLMPLPPCFEGVSSFMIITEQLRKGFVQCLLLAEPGFLRQDYSSQSREL